MRAARAQQFWIKLRTFLAALLSIVCASAATDLAYAQPKPIDQCTRAYGAWVEQRNVSLKRLDATYTLLGLDNTWCAPAMTYVAGLRARLVDVRAACAGVADTDRRRIEALIARTTKLLDRVAPCAQTVTAEAGGGALPWQTSVEKDAPAKGRQVQTATVRARPEADSWTATVVQPAQAASKVDKPAKPREIEAPRVPVQPVQVASTGAGTGTDRRSTGASPKQDVHVYAVQAGSQQGAPPDDEECLVVTRTSAASYLIENRNCRPQVVLTAIEVNPTGKAVRCFTKRVADGIAIAGEAGAQPQINFQCREGAQGCAEGLLRGMFPECQPG